METQDRFPVLQVGVLLLGLALLLFLLLRPVNDGSNRYYQPLQANLDRMYVSNYLSGNPSHSLVFEHFLVYEQYIPQINIRLSDQMANITPNVLNIAEEQSLTFPGVTCTPEEWPIPQRPEILPASLNQIQLLSSFECNAPIELRWSSNGEYLAISTSEAIWVHTLSDERTPLRFPPTASETSFEPGAFRFSQESDIFATVDPTSGNLNLWDLSETPHDRVIEAQIESSDGFYQYDGFAAISPDLSMWAVAFRDGSIYLLDASTGEELVSLEGHIRIGALAFTPDGKLLISGGKDGGSSENVNDTDVRVWDTETGEMLALFDVGSPLNFSANPLQSIAISSNGESASFAVNDVDLGTTSIGLIDLTTLDYTSFSIENRGVKMVAFGSNNDMLTMGTYDLEGTYDYFITFLDLENRSVINHLSFDNLVFNVAFNSEGTLMAVAYEDSPNARVEIWAVGD